ncbi:hypothetical protein Xoosp13_40 [Xanthomonas phage Xoo-sp13]|nr:hypothetical protein Xoosp13_40 [Xanthomonas phage Xoo-sp13]
MTLREARKNFNENIKPAVIKQYGNDTIALNTAFNDWTDSLHRSGEITDAQYHNWTRK